MKEKIICYFKGHDSKVVETKKVRGLLFGGICKSSHHVCKRCGSDRGWFQTESLQVNFK